MVVLVYVDDIVLVGPPIDVLNQVKHNLEQYFKLKDLRVLRYFLGLEIVRSAKGIVLNQQKYILTLLDDTGFLGYKPASLPMDPYSRLSVNEGNLLEDVSQYRRLVGRLSYIQISHPYITFTVNKLSQFASQPQEPHLCATHHLL